MIFLGFPVFNEKDYIGLNGVSKMQLLHPHFELCHKWFISDYKAPKDKMALFIPCAAIKPYYNSPIHKIINKRLKNYENMIHKVVISNAGVIPYEYCDRYPFDSYDWNPLAEDKQIQKEYYKVTKKRIREYLLKHKYKAYISYLRTSSISHKALNDTCKEIGLKLYHPKLNEQIQNDKDTDLILIYDENIQKLIKTLKGLI